MGFWSVFKKKERFSNEHLYELYTTIKEKLQNGNTLSEEDKSVVIESVRDMAEVLIYGDQNGKNFFEFFLENDMFKLLFTLLDHSDKEIQIQLIQTLGILVENIKDVNSLYFILSNNYINNLISTGINPLLQPSVDDFPDTIPEKEREALARQKSAELLAYYVSFIKTLSLRLDPKSVNFFFNVQQQEFPLYTEATKLYSNPDGMVRISVRVLTLNCYKIDLPVLRDYLVRTAPPYFNGLMGFIRDQCLRLAALSQKDSEGRGIDDRLAEICDNFYYVQDVLSLGIESLSHVMSQCFLERFVFPFIMGSLLGDANVSERLPASTALFLLAQIFYVFKHGPVVNTICDYLFHPTTAVPLSIISQSVFYNAKDTKNKFKDVILSFFESDNDTEVISLLSFIYAFIMNPYVNHELLKEIGMEPIISKESKKEDGDNDKKDKPIKRIWRHVNNPFNLSARPGGSETFDRIDPLRGIVPDHSETEASKETSEKSDATPEDSTEASPDELFNAIAKGLHTIILKNHLFRPITLKLCILVINILKEKSAGYVDETKSCYEKGYESAVERLKEQMKLHPSDVFLKMFEKFYNTQMSRTFYFDSFVTEGTALMSLGQQLEIERFDEPRKLLQDSIGNFFVLRKERYSANSEVDSLMPLKCVPLPTEKYKLKTYFPKSTDVIYYMYYTENFKKIYKHYFVIFNGAIVILDDPSINSSLKTLSYLPIPRERDIAPTSVIISAVLPMHDFEIRHNIDKKMNTFTLDVSAPKLNIKMYLSNFGFLKFSKEALEKGREDARSFKMAQVYTALSIDESELPLSRVDLPPLVDETKEEKSDEDKSDDKKKENGKGDDEVNNEKDKKDDNDIKKENVEDKKEIKEEDKNSEEIKEENNINDDKK